MRDWNQEFTRLLGLDREALHVHLAECLIELATVFETIAECRSDEALKTGTSDTSKAERYRLEAVRDSLIEKKWFILNLLEIR